MIPFIPFTPLKWDDRPISLRTHRWETDRSSRALDLFTGCLRFVLRWIRFVFRRNHQCVGSYITPFPLNLSLSHILLLSGWPWDRILVSPLLYTSQELRLYGTQIFLIHLCSVKEFSRLHWNCFGHHHGAVWAIPLLLFNDSFHGIYRPRDRSQRPFIP